MSSERKPLWFRLLKRLVISLLSIALTLVAIYAFVKIKYDVDLVSVLGDLSQMTKTVNEKSLFPDVFSDDDLPSMKLAINSSIPGYITDDYKVSETVYAYGLEQDLKLTNKNLGSFVNLLLQDNGPQTIQLAGNDIQYQIIQIGFYDFDSEQNTARFNVVLKLDMREMKQTLKDFPLSFIKKYITDDFYISVNVIVKKESPSYSYSISGGELLLNSLSRKQSAELFQAFSLLSKQSPEEQAKLIANPILEVLLDGTKEQTLANFMKDSFSSPDYVFETENDEVSLVYKKA